MPCWGPDQGNHHAQRGGRALGFAVYVKNLCLYYNDLYPVMESRAKTKPMANTADDLIAGMHSSDDDIDNGDDSESSSTAAKTG